MGLRATISRGLLVFFPSLGNYAYSEFLSHRVAAQQIKSFAQDWNKLVCKREMVSWLCLLS